MSLRWITVTARGERGNKEAVSEARRISNQGIAAKPGQSESVNK